MPVVSYKFERERYCRCADCNAVAETFALAVLCLVNCDLLILLNICSLFLVSQSNLLKTIFKVILGSNTKESRLSIFKYITLLFCIRISDRLGKNAEVHKSFKIDFKIQ